MLAQFPLVGSSSVIAPGFRACVVTLDLAHCLSEDLILEKLNKVWAELARQQLVKNRRFFQNKSLCQATGDQSRRPLYG
jgi:hypothetical protein